VASELDFKETARAFRRIDRVIASASRDVEALLHRRFYPEIGVRYFDWPNPQRARPWRLWLDDNELISITALSSGGVTISADDYFLEPNTSGPPYRRVDLDLDSSAVFGGGDTHQRDISIAGLWGFRDDETAVGALAGAVDGSTTTVTVDAEASAEIGVGSLLRIEDERVIVTGRAMATTGQTLAADLGGQLKNTAVSVADSSAVAEGETILIDGERMHVVDIAGNTLIVKREQDGSTLAAHATGATLYAPRSLTVVRGALGTTAAAHSDGATVHRWDPPGPVRELVIAEALTVLLQGRAGWARTAGSAESQREVSGRGLRDLRDRVYTSHGRKARLRGV
jgi:hypothetical protein